MSADNSVSAASVSGEKLNKRFAVFIIIFSAVEAVLTFLLVLYPLYIQPIFHNAFLDERGIPYTVHFFGKIFSENTADPNTIVFSSASSYLHIVLILLLLTGIPIALAVFFRKGYTFSKIALAGIFGIKFIIGLMPVLIPLNNAIFSIKLFGVIDSVLCFLICSVIVYLNSLEYSYEMRFNNDGIRSCRYRAALYFILFLMFTALAVLESRAMPGYGINWSIYLGKDDQELYQGLILTVLLTAALFCSSMYSRVSKLPLCFYVSFGSAVMITNILALVNKVIWYNTVYKGHKAAALSGDESEIMWLHQNGLTKTWWLRTVFIFICALLGGAIAYFAFVHLIRTLKTVLSKDQIKSKTIVLCFCGAAALLFFASTITAITLWDRRAYSEFVLGAMDYMYFILFGGSILFTILGMFCGHIGVKWALLSVYILFGIENFGSIFAVLRMRRQFAAQYPGYVGYDFIASAIWFGVSVICAFTILILFCSKDIDDFLYRIKTAELESEAVWYEAKKDRAKIDRALRKEEHAERSKEKALRRSEYKKISEAIKTEKSAYYAENKKLNEARKIEMTIRRAEVKKINDTQKNENAVRRAEVKKVTDAQKAEKAARNAEVKKIVNSQKAEAVVRAAEVKKVTDTQKAEKAARNAEVKKIVDSQKAEADVRSAEVKKVTDAQKAELAIRREEVKKITVTQKAEMETRRAEVKRVIDDQKAEKSARRAEVKKISDAQKAEKALLLAEVKKIADSQKAERNAQRADDKQVTDAQKNERNMLWAEYREVVNSQRSTISTLRAEAKSKDIQREEIKEVSDAHKTKRREMRENIKKVTDSQNAVKAELKAKAKQLSDSHKAVIEKQRAEIQKMTDAHKAVMNEQRAETQKMTDAHKAVMENQRAETKKMIEAHKAVMEEQRAITKKMTDAHKAVMDEQRAITKKMTDAHKAVMDEQRAITKKMTDAHRAVMDEQHAITKKMTDAHKAVMNEQRMETKKMTDAHKAVMNEQRAETKKITDAHNAENAVQYRITQRLIEVHNTAKAANDSRARCKLDALNEEKTALHYKAKREMDVLKTIQASRRSKAMKEAKEREMKNWEAAKNG